MFYFATQRHFKDMHKRYDIAIEYFRKSCKNISVVYHTGYHKWTNTMGCTTYSLVLGCFRIMLYKYDRFEGCDCLDVI